MRLFILSGFVVLLPVTVASAQPPTAATNFQSACAPCHEGAVDRAPGRSVLHEMTADRVLAAMESGPMISMAVRFSARERRDIAEFVTGKPITGVLTTAPPQSAMCKTGASQIRDLRGPVWNGWGRDDVNSRFQGAASAGFTAADVPRLKLKWAFAFPGELTRNAASTLAAGRLFVGSASGLVYSLDAASGCIHWYYDAKAPVRSAPLLARVKTPSGMRYAVIFGDQGGAYMHAVDASSGQLLWKQRLDDYPVARITGSSVFYRGRVYVGVSSSEEGTGSIPTDECCKFRGSLVALDASTGRIVWKRYMVEPASPRRKNKLGVQLWGPSGVPIWSSPAVDAKLGRIYVTTGDNYSEPTSRYSDSFVALDASTGRILWSRQMTSMDAYTSACRLPDRTNCPASNGPDFDFGSSPMLVNLPNGRRLLVAGQKSGIVHALDPDQRGKVVWQVRVGQGGTEGGVQWGQATDGTLLYVANADLGRLVVPFAQNTDADPRRGGGMFALRLTDGQKVWYTAPVPCGERPRCSPAQSGAVSAIPGIAFSGSYDGHLRAYSAVDGKVVWDFDTERAYDSVDGEPGRGGTLDGAGPVIGGGLLYVNSGYAVSGGQPGNVLLAFSVDGK